VQKVRCVTVTKVNTKTIEKKVLEFFNGLVETYTKALTSRMKEMVTVRCTGKMEVVTKVNGLMEFNTATAK